MAWERHDIEIKEAIFKSHSPAGPATNQMNLSQLNHSQMSAWCETATRVSCLTALIQESETVVNYTNQSRYMVTTGVVNVSYDNQESPSSRRHEDIVIMCQATVSFYTSPWGRQQVLRTFVGR